jgi:polysaccharide pyruvyl transferase CsaB
MVTANPKVSTEAKAQDPVVEGRNVRKILLSGWYGMDNAGDEAILQQLIHEFVELDGFELTVLSERPERVEACYGNRGIRAIHHHSFLGGGLLRGLWKGEFQALLRAVREADLFILGGGGIIRDNTSWRNVIRLLDEVWLANLVGTPTALYAVGAGPFKTRARKWVIGKTVRSCKLITVREESSKLQIAAMDIPPERIVSVADPALLLAPMPVKDPDLFRRLSSLASSDRVLGLFVEEDDTPVAALASALDRLHQEHGFSFVSIPMRVHEGKDDRQTARAVRTAMQHPEAVELVEQALTAPEIKWLAGTFSLNLTVRLHALIFSLAMKTPAVAINYEPKVANFMRSFDLGAYLVDPSGDVTEQLVQKVLEGYAARTTYLDHLEAKLPERLEAASRTCVLLRSLLDGAGPHGKTE